MKREEIKNILGEGATDEVVTKLLDALHAEIEPHKTAAKTAQDALAAKVAEIDELSKKTTDADELKKQLNDLKAKYDAETKEAAEKLAQIEFDGAVKDVLTKHGAAGIASRPITQNPRHVTALPNRARARSPGGRPGASCIHCRSIRFPTPAASLQERLQAPVSSLCLLRVADDGVVGVGGAPIASCLPAV